MKRTLAVLVLVLLAALATWATTCPSKVQCPVDETNAYPTGDWEHKNGHEWREYRCTNILEQHTFWVKCPKP